MGGGVMWLLAEQKNPGLFGEARIFVKNNG